MINNYQLLRNNEINANNPFLILQAHGNQRALSRAANIVTAKLACNDTTFYIIHNDGGFKIIFIEQRLNRFRCNQVCIMFHQDQFLWNIKFNRLNTRYFFKTLYDQRAL